MQVLWLVLALVIFWKLNTLFFITDNWFNNQCPSQSLNFIFFQVKIGFHYLFRCYMQRISNLLSWFKPSCFFFPQICLYSFIKHFCLFGDMGSYKYRRKWHSQTFSFWLNSIYGQWIIFVILKSLQPTIGFGVLR